MFKSHDKNALIPIKIDIEKTYDRVSRNAIINIRRHINFSNIFIQLTKSFFLFFIITLMDILLNILILLGGLYKGILYPPTCLLLYNNFYLHQ